MRTVVSWAWFRPVGEGVGRGRPLVPLRHRRRRRPERGVRRRCPQTAKGLLPGRTDDRWLVCADGPTVAEGAKVPCTEEHHVAGGDHHQARRAGRRLPGRPARRGDHPRLLLRLGRRLAELPGRLRLRLHLVPRGRVGGRQPALGLLGEDRPTDAVAASPRGALAVAAAASCWPPAPATTDPRADPDGLGRPAPRRPSAAEPRRGPRKAPATGSSYDDAARLTSDAAAPDCRREHTVGHLRRRRPRHASSTATCSRSTPSACRSRWPTTCPRLLAEYVGGSLEAAAAEHAAGGVVHPHRRGVRRRRGLVPLRRGRARRRRASCATLDGVAAGRARHRRGPSRVRHVRHRRARDRATSSGSPAAAARTRGGAVGRGHLRRPTTTPASRPPQARRRGAVRGRRPRAVADDPLDFQWGYEWPTAGAVGRRPDATGICWVPSDPTRTLARSRSRACAAAAGRAASPWRS